MERDVNHPLLKQRSFLLQRIPIGFSTGLKSRSSCGTMSRSLLGSALRGTEIERFMCTSRPSEPDRSTNIYMVIKAYILCLLRKDRSTFFLRSKHADISRGTIHLNPEWLEFSLPLDPDAIKLEV
jgi:hypothetical protein